MATTSNSEFYRNEVYFGCNQYSDKIINHFLYSAWDKSYSRCLYRQKEYSSTMCRTIPLSNFVVDGKLNNKLKIPARSFTCKLNGFSLPIADKKRFVQRYGNFNKAVALKDVMRDGQTFSFSLDCSIGIYGYLDLYIYPTVFNYSYLIIIPTFVATDMYPQDENEIYETFESNTPTPAGRLTVDKIRSMIELGYKLTIQWTRHGEVHRFYGRFDSLITKGATQITLPKNAFASFTKRDTDSNSWDIYVTDTSAQGVFLFMRFVSSVIRITNDTIVFSIPSTEISNYILRNITGSIYAIHRPTRKACLYYEHQLDLAPIFELEDLSAPATQMNYLISEIDSTKKTKMQTEILDTIPEFYPNVINLTGTQWDGKNLLIETYERPKQDATCFFENPIQNYMDSVGSDYASVIVNPYKTPAVLQGYHPSLNPTLEGYDYLTSPYKGNIRGYYLNVLNDVCQDNPIMYKYLQRTIDDMNKKFSTRSGSPSYLKFNNNYVMDNSALAVVKEDETTHFAEMQGILRYTTEEEDTPALFYVNGALEKITLSYYHAGFQYLYIAKSIVDSEMEKYTDDTQIEKCKPLTVDAFPKYSRSSSSNFQETHRFYSIGEMQTLFEGITSRTNISLNDIIFYVNGTMEYIDLSQLSFGFLANEYLLDHENADETVLLDKTTSAEFLMTVYSEIYRTLDTQEIVLRNADVSISMDDYIASLPNGVESIANKDFALGTLQIGIKDPKLIGVDIVAAVGNRFDNREISGISVISADHKIVYTKYYAPKDKRRIEVYMDGKLLNGEEYELQFPTQLGGDLIIDLSVIMNQISPESKFNVVVLPIPFETLEYKLTDSTMKTFNFITNEYNRDMNIFNGAETGITLYELAPDPSAKASQILDFKNSRMFLNGMRFAYEEDDSIKLVNTLTLREDDLTRALMLRIPTEVLGNSTVTIKYPCRDMDIYKMNGLAMNGLQQTMISW